MATLSILRFTVYTWNMTLRSRRKLFVFFLVLFVLASIGIVYYTQGYRFDFQTRILTQTGSLYIESYERPVSIFLNEKLYTDKSGLLKNGTLISSVLPKKYSVRIEKDGFIPYEKNIEISPFQVTRLFHVLLVPSDLQPSAVFPAPDSTTLLSAHETGKLFIENENDSIVILDTVSRTTPLAIHSYLASLTRGTFTDFSFRPGTVNTIIGFREGTPFSIQIDTDTITPLIASRFEQYVTGDAYLFGFATSSVEVYNLQSGSRVDVFSMPFSAIDVVDVQGFDLRYAFLLTDGDVWVRQDGIFEKIAHDAQVITLSPDGYKVLFQDTHGPVFVHVLRDEYEALDVPKKTTLRVQVVDASSLTSLQWHADSYHFFAGYADRITLSELTRGEPTNQPWVWDDTYDSFRYEPRSQALFILKDDVVSRFEAW